jgi:hypothetical protein
MSPPYFAGIRDTNQVIIAMKISASAMIVSMIRPGNRADGFTPADSFRASADLSASGRNIPQLLFEL